MCKTRAEWNQIANRMFASGYVQEARQIWWSIRDMPDDGMIAFTFLPQDAYDLIRQFEAGPVRE
jgi:hypothetical protein